ncbi:hypothetical protein NQ317_008592 [Molorchus minor]|uniref:Uncharacterized protein n=1 Tax=Molorchus minor TaxID=1323400 RepID=A0ABQ9JKL7_9CUCU|nr:hypothetical protein NQ317_008592 [Molorchus minor]
MKPYKNDVGFSEILISDETSMLCKIVLLIEELVNFSRKLVVESEATTLNHCPLKESALLVLVLEMVLNKTDFISSNIINYLKSDQPAPFIAMCH